MAISAFKTCKVWFSLNPSMCSSGFYRISGSNIHFSLSVFFLFTTTLLIVLFSKKSPFFFSLFRCLSFVTYRAFYSTGSISHFSHSFLLSALIPLKVPGWLLSSGCAEVCPSRSHHLSILYLPFFPIWAESHSAKLKVAWCHSLFRISLFWFPETLPACVMRGR